MFSDLLLRADIAQCSQHVRFVANSRRPSLIFVSLAARIQISECNNHWNGENTDRRKMTDGNGSRHVSKVPETASCAAVEGSHSIHLIGSGDECGRNVYAERFSCFEVYDQVEFGRLHDR